LYELYYFQQYFIENLYLIVRLFLAMFLGGIIGLERGRLNRPAGIRTHMIVCMASALIMMLGIYMQTVDPNLDVTRLGAQVVSGVGFLGAGAILKDGFSVRGLTTAATLWVVACVGLAVGGGFYIAAILTTLLVYVSLKIWGTSSVKTSSRYLSVMVYSVDETVDHLKMVLVNYGIHISEIGLYETDKSNIKEIRFYGTFDMKTDLDSVLLDVVRLDNIKSAHLE
jgi:putative Mg2+ transporter-C (MgtC) family protein